MMRSAHLLALGCFGAVVIAACTKVDLAPNWAGGTPTVSGTSTPTPTVTLTGTPPPQDYGNGQDGPYSPGGGNQHVNSCNKVISGSNLAITIQGGGFNPGQRVLVIQMQDDFATSGAQGQVTAPGTAGLWEIPRVASIAGPVLTMDSALAHTYSSSGTKRAQVCTVPEYTTATIPAGTTLQPQNPWNGTTGGIVAFLTSANLDIEGTIDVSGQGFRGGAIPPGGGGAGDTDLDSPAPSNDGGKGEAVDGRAWTLFGRGNYADGAGGGGGTAGGGGGGSGAGAGGLGGLELSSAGNDPNTQGLGGAVMGPTLIQKRVFFGGGGGAGENSVGVPGAGGAGGGLVLIIAHSLSGAAGTILSNGVVGANGGKSPPPTSDASGGGGAGGTVFLQFTFSTFSGTVDALGAAGGSPSDGKLGGGVNEGPGGGGGGGLVYAPGLSAGTVDVTGAASGTNAKSGSAAGATAGGNGASFR